MAKDLNVPLTDITQVAERLKKADLKKYATDKVGEPTLRDILAELEKPGRDPRAEFKYATFKEGVKDLRDLTVGMELEGVITNVAKLWCVCRHWRTPRRAGACIAVGRSVC